MTEAKTAADKVDALLGVGLAHAGSCGYKLGDISHRVLSPVSSTMSSAFPKERLSRLPASVPRMTTSRRPVFRGCRYSLMFRPPSLLTPRSFLPLRILPQGSRGFYVRAYRALLPPHAPDMLTVRIQAIDGTGTFTLSDSQPCRLLTFLHGGSLVERLPMLHPPNVMPSTRTGVVGRPPSGTRVRGLEVCSVDGIGRMVHKGNGPRSGTGPVP
jgi:hypothetical protein